MSCEVEETLFFPLQLVFNKLWFHLPRYSSALLANGGEIKKVLEELTGQTTVPNVFVNETHVGGCDNTIKAHGEGRLLELLNKPKYDYDLIVIGGGSGGLAASKVFD